MSSDINADLELELGELLQEFQDVVEELKAPSQSKQHAYQHVLVEAKTRTGVGDDSGVEDSDYSSEASMGNSLNTSEEELHTAGVTLAQKAKLGDTKELESFIDMLDRELADVSIERKQVIYARADLMEQMLPLPPQGKRLTSEIKRALRFEMQEHPQTPPTAMVCPPGKTTSLHHQVQDV